MKTVDAKRAQEFLYEGLGHRALDASDGRVWRMYSETTGSVISRPIASSVDDGEDRGTLPHGRYLLCILQSNGDLLVLSADRDRTPTAVEEAEEILQHDGNLLLFSKSEDDEDEDDNERPKLTPDEAEEIRFLLASLIDDHDDTVTDVESAREGYEHVRARLYEFDEVEELLGRLSRKLGLDQALSPAEILKQTIRGLGPGDIDLDQLREVRALWQKLRRGLRPASLRGQTIADLTFGAVSNGLRRLSRRLE